MPVPEDRAIDAAGKVRRCHHFILSYKITATETEGGKAVAFDALLIATGTRARTLDGLMERGVPVTPAELADESVPLRNLLQRAAG